MIPEADNQLQVGGDRQTGMNTSTVQVVEPVRTMRVYGSLLLLVLTIFIPSFFGPVLAVGLLGWMAWRYLYRAGIIDRLLNRAGAIKNQSPGFKHGFFRSLGGINKDMSQNIIRTKRFIELASQLEERESVPYLNGVNAIDYICGYTDEIIPQSELEDNEKEACRQTLMSMAEEIMESYLEDPDTGVIIWVPKSEC